MSRVDMGKGKSKGKSKGKILFHKGRGKYWGAAKGKGMITYYGACKEKRLPPWRKPYKCKGRPWPWIRGNGKGCPSQDPSQAQKGSGKRSKAKKAKSQECKGQKGVPKKGKPSKGKGQPVGGAPLRFSQIPKKIPRGMHIEKEDLHWSKKKKYVYGRPMSYMKKRV